MQYVVRLITVIVAVGFWSTLGFAVWLAIVVREVTIVSLATVISLISNKPPLRDGTYLDEASRILPSGYTKILTQLFTAPPESAPAAEPEEDEVYVGRRRHVTPVSNPPKSEDFGLDHFIAEFLYAVFFYLSLAWISDYFFSTNFSPIQRILGLLGVPLVDMGVTNLIQGIVLAAVVIIVIPFTALKVYSSWRDRNQYHNRGGFWPALIAMVVGFSVAAAMIYWAFGLGN
jgi:hypothetical protein